MYALWCKFPCFWLSDKKKSFGLNDSSNWQSPDRMANQSGVSPHVTLAIQRFRAVECVFTPLKKMFLLSINCLICNISQIKNSGRKFKFNQGSGDGQLVHRWCDVDKCSTNEQLGRFLHLVTTTLVPSIQQLTEGRRCCFHTRFLSVLTLSGRLWLLPQPFLRSQYLVLLLLSLHFA